MLSQRLLEVSERKEDNDLDGKTDHNMWIDQVDRLIQAMAKPTLPRSHNAYYFSIKLISEHFSLAYHWPFIGLVYFASKQRSDN